MIKEQEIDIKVNSRHYDYYTSKGYIINRIYNERKQLVVPKGTILRVNISDLVNGSHEMVTIVCDKCGSIIKHIPFYSFVEGNHFNKKHICEECKETEKINKKLEKEKIKIKKDAEKKKVRVCCVCHKELPLTSEFFHRDKSSKFGFTYDCKECRNKDKPVKYNHEDVGKEIDYTDNYKHGVYIIRNSINGKIYIGSAVNLYRRMYNHLFQLKNNIHHSIHLQRAWNKYGKDSFKFYIAEYVENKNNLIEREQHWLDTYKPYDINYGYNIRNIAESNLGKKLSEDTKTKIGDAVRGRKLSKETRQKISDSNKGKIGQGRKKIVQIDIDGNLIKIYEAISFVSIDGFNSSTVSRCCIHKQETSGGYLWYYLDEYNRDDFKIPKLEKSIYKRILQFDLDGNFIREWRNSEECKSNSYNSNQILACCNGYIKTHNNYIWIFKEDSDLDIEINLLKYKDKIEERKVSKHYFYKSLLQFDIHGNIIKEWNGIEATCKALGYNNLYILDEKNNKITSNGYIWIYKDDYYNNKKYFYKFFKPVILQFTLNGDFIREWDKASDITKNLSLNNRPITQCCNNKNGSNSAYGFLWRYKIINDDYTININKNTTYKKEIIQYKLIDNKLIFVKEWNSIYRASTELKINRQGLTKHLKDKNIKQYKDYVWRYKEDVI